MLRFKFIVTIIEAIHLLPADDRQIPIYPFPSFAVRYPEERRTENSENIEQENRSRERVRRRDTEFHYL